MITMIIRIIMIMIRMIMMIIMIIMIIMMIIMIIMIIKTGLYWRHLNLTILKIKIKQSINIYNFKLYIRKYLHNFKN